MLFYDLEFNHELLTCNSKIYLHTYICVIFSFIYYYMLYFTKL